MKQQLSRHRLACFLAACVVLVSLRFFSSSPDQTLFIESSSEIERPFRIHGTKFLLHGQPFRIISCEYATAFQLLRIASPGKSAHNCYIVQIALFPYSGRVLEGQSAQEQSAGLQHSPGAARYSVEQRGVCLNTTCYPVPATIEFSHKMCRLKRS
jgi:hypothetical protein